MLVEKTDTSVKEASIYPEKRLKISEAHGGLENWKINKTLTYDLPKKGFVEKHTIDLYSRKDKVVGPDYSLEFNGEHVWLFNESESYKGDAIFYHNPMFYFYAMPFVLADNGITYSETKDLEFEGVSYLGIGISYNDGVGASSKDNY